MDKSTFWELADVQDTLSTGISMFYVIRDGLTSFTKHSSLSGKNAEIYVNAMQSACEVLCGATERIQKMLDKVALPEQENIV